MIAFLDKLEEVINKLVSALLTPCFFLLAGISFIQVVSRYFLKVSLPWSEELCRYLFIYATYLGSVIGVTQNRHVDITIIDSFLEKMAPRKRKSFEAVLNIFTSAVSAFVLGWITFLDVPYLMNVYKFGQQTPAMGIALYIPLFSVLLGMGLMCLLFTKKFIKGVLNLFLMNGGAVLD
jgi:C4-dicarboxylate transporter DctQ subunit